MSKKIYASENFVQSTVQEEIVKLQNRATVEPECSDIPRVFITGEIPTTKNAVNAELTYVSNTETFHAYISIKCQGTSSMSYPKKNFTVSMYADPERTVALRKDFRGWGAQSKFCLKANYIDSTHTRNIICARLWSKACDTRANLNERLAAAPNNGAIDGFHIKVYANGVYQGLYTWNIPKDGWMFGMEDNGNEAVYCCEVQTEAGQFRQEVLADESDWSLEYPDAEEVNSSVLAGFNNLVRIVRDTSDEEFISQISSVLDVEAAIDYYLFCYYFAALDQLGKNLIMITYDGGASWIPSAYDNDSTWGSWWDGTYMVSPEYKCPEDYQCSASLLWQRIEELLGDRLYDRYQQLTGPSGPWSLANILTEVERFYDIPRRELYTEDKSVYPGIPTNVTLGGMRNFMANRKPYVDRCLYEIGVYITLESIKIQKETLTLGAGDSVMLRVLFVPDNARNRNFTVTSNSSVVTVEENGEFVILTVADNVGSNQTALIEVTAEEGTGLSNTLTLNIVTSATQSHRKPVVSFDSTSYSNGVWTDTVRGTSMMLSGTPAVSEDGVLFDGSQYFYFENNSLANSNIAVEFMGVLEESVNGYNILTVGPDSTFSWYNTYCVWNSAQETTNFQYCSVLLAQDLTLEDSKKYIHFVATLPSSLGQPANIYFNQNGRLITYSGSFGGTNNPKWSYISNAEGANHFVGTIRRLNVYDYIPTVSEVKEILGIPSVDVYSTVTITSDMMEVGSLSNVPGMLGEEVDWSEETRTSEHVTLPTDALEVSLNSYYDTDRIYFYDSNYRGILEVVVSSANERVVIPEKAVYMKFLLKTPALVNTNVTYYK